MTEKLAQLLTNTVNVPNYSMPNTGSAPRIVTDTINQELQKAARFNEQQGKAQAKLANLGDFLATRVNPQFNKSATDIGILGNKMRGEADLLGLALKDAEAKAYNPTAQLLKKGTKVSNIPKPHRHGGASKCCFVTQHGSKGRLIGAVEPPNGQCWAPTADNKL